LSPGCRRPLTRRRWPLRLCRLPCPTGLHLRLVFGRQRAVSKLQPECVPQHSCVWLQCSGRRPCTRTSAVTKAMAGQAMFQPNNHGFRAGWGRGSSTGGSESATISRHSGQMALAPWVASHNRCPAPRRSMRIEADVSSRIACRDSEISPQQSHRLLELFERLGKKTSLFPQQVQYLQMCGRPQSRFLFAVWPTLIRWGAKHRSYGCLLYSQSRY
jgi:hypothetical protein